MIKDTKCFFPFIGQRRFLVVISIGTSDIDLANNSGNINKTEVRFPKIVLATASMVLSLLTLEIMVDARPGTIMKLAMEM